MNIARKRGRGLPISVADALARPDEYIQLRKLRDLPAMKSYNLERMK